MAKNNGLGLTQTKGTYQLRGVVTGVEKDNFYKETTTKNNKPFRAINFGIKIDKESTIYQSLTGMERDKVYFSKKETVDGKKKTVTQDVAWKDRFDFNREGYSLIGVKVGVTKTIDDKGKEINDKKTLTDYDACKDIAENLKDDDSVFVRGNIDYSTFKSNKDDSVKHSIKFVPTQVSLCKPIDFDVNDFKSISDFTQVIVFNGIEQDTKEKGKFIVKAKIINYNTIEDAEFVTYNTGLATTFRKNLKPYNAIKVWGDIVTKQSVEKVESAGVWGEENEMEKVNAPIERELVIKGADPSTLDTELYSESKIEEAIAKIKANEKAENDFGKDVSDDWGSVDSLDSGSDNSDEPW